MLHLVGILFPQMNTLVVSRFQIKEIKGVGTILCKMSEEIHMNAQISSVRIYF